MSLHFCLPPRWFAFFLLFIMYFFLSCCTHIHSIIAIHNLCTSLHITRGNPFMCKLSNAQTIQVYRTFCGCQLLLHILPKVVFLIVLLQVHYWRTKAQTLFSKSKTIKVILVNVIFLNVIIVLSVCDPLNRNIRNLCLLWICINFAKYDAFFSWGTWLSFSLLVDCEH